jgi:acetyltransferase-like isoleucine patch superfamily enzyme
MMTHDRLREALKAATRSVATLVVAPMLLSFSIRRIVLGADRALEGSTQLLALVPGLPGQYLRRAFLMRVLDACDKGCTVEFGTIFSRTGARLGRNAYVGPACHLGLVDVGDDVMLAPGVHVPSGGHVHGTDDLSTPMREQQGVVRRVRIGAGAWIGANSVVMADVGAGSIVGAGAVVTKAIPPGVTAAGVPARVVAVRDHGPGYAHPVSHPSATVRS